MKYQAEFNTVVTVVLFILLLKLQVQTSLSIMDKLISMDLHDVALLVAHSSLSIFVLETILALYMVIRISTDPFYRPFILLQWWLGEFMYLFTVIVFQR